MDFKKEVDPNSEEYKRFNRNMNTFVVPLIDHFIINGTRSFITLELSYFGEYILEEINPNYEYIKSLILYWAKSNSICVEIKFNYNGYMLSCNPLVWFDVKFSLGDD